MLSRLVGADMRTTFNADTASLHYVYTCPPEHENVKLPASPWNSATSMAMTQVASDVEKDFPYFTSKVG